MSPTPIRWLFGDQLGPHFIDDHGGPVLMVESKAVFRRRRFHRAKAQLVLSAMRHRAAELGDRVTYVRAEEYAGAMREHVGAAPVEVVHPTSYAALGLVERLGEELDLSLLAPRGFATTLREPRAFHTSIERHRSSPARGPWLEACRSLERGLPPKDPVGSKACAGLASPVESNTSSIQ